MRGAKTSIQRHGSLLFGNISFPGGDTFVDRLGENIVLAEAVVIAVVLAFRDRDPRLETAWKN